MNQQPSHLRRLVAARTVAASRGMNVESVNIESVSETDPPHTDDVLARVQDTMKRMPQSEIADAEQFELALTTLLQQADKTLRKIDRDPVAPLDSNDALTVEAVIRTDGTRPSLLVRDNTVDPDHPLAGNWRDTLRAVRDSLRERIAAIGRVEPAIPSAGSFFGTGWLVDRNKGLVLTNLHVVEAMWRRLPNAMLPQPDRSFLVLPGAAFIDFAAESGSLEKRRFRIVQATPSGVEGNGFGRLDAAVLRIEPLPGNSSPELPQPIPVLADLDGPLGNVVSFCVVGYPGNPPFTSGVHEGVDWMWVNATLFGGRFGVKRLAPGQAHKPLGTLTGDAKQWVFGHDATTLGGSSGSPVLSWLSTEKGSFGLHFAGASVDTNCAHAIAQIGSVLEKLGVPVQSVV